MRYLLIEIGPELRQYLVAHNREALFNRLEREWIYASAEGENNFGFGTDDQPYGIGYPVIKHSVFPVPDRHDGDPGHPIPCAKLIGAKHYRCRALSPELDHQHLGDEPARSGKRDRGAQPRGASGGLLSQHR